MKKLVKLLLSIIRSFNSPRFSNYRVRLYRKLGMKIGNNVKIKSGTIIEFPENIEIGDNVSIQHNCFISAYGKIIIGNNVSIAHGVSILTSTHDYTKAEILRDAPLLCGNITIKSNVWIGMKSSIFYDLTIGAGVIIGAHSLVKNDIKDDLIVAGTPCKVLKMRK